MPDMNYDYPEGITTCDHLAHDIERGRFPERSSISQFICERGAPEDKVAPESTAKIAALANRFWSIHPSNLDDLGLTREEFYASQMTKLLASETGRLTALNNKLTEDFNTLALDRRRWQDRAEEAEGEWEKFRTLAFNRGALLDEIGQEVWMAAAKKINQPSENDGMEECGNWSAADPISREQRSAPRWQDIKTAPKNGTKIIGGTDDEETAFVCAWDAHDGFNDGDWLQYGSDLVKPTKWIPMPANGGMNANDK